MRNPTRNVWFPERVRDGHGEDNFVYNSSLIFAGGIDKHK